MSIDDDDDLDFETPVVRVQFAWDSGDYNLKHLGRYVLSLEDDVVTHDFRITVEGRKGSLLVKAEELEMETCERTKALMREEFKPLDLRDIIREKRKRANNPLRH